MESEQGPVVVINRDAAVIIVLAGDEPLSAEDVEGADKSIITVQINQNGRTARIVHDGLGEQDLRTWSIREEDGTEIPIQILSPAPYDPNTIRNMVERIVGEDRIPIGVLVALLRNYGAEAVQKERLPTHQARAVPGPSGPPHVGPSGHHNTSVWRWREDA